MTFYNPVSPETIEDPYPFYRRLHDEAPVYHVEDLDLWVLTRYDDVQTALRDPTAFSSQSGMGLLMGGGPPGRMRDFVRRQREGFAGLSYDELAGLRMLIMSDPPDHTRLRRLVNKGFTPKMIGQLEGRIREIATRMVDEMIAAGARGEADFVAHLACPLPVIVIAEMLGIPAERREDFKRWSDSVVGALSGIDKLRAQSESLEMVMYFNEVIEERRAAPQHDLISMLVRNSEGGDSLNTMEIVMFCVLLLIAGNETTTNLLSNGALVMFERPELCQRLRENPALIPAAVEETLRYDSPVQSLFRATTRPVTIGGVTLPADAAVQVLFGAANRDPQHYSDPDTFSLERNPTDHLAFGWGIHLCLGAPLARLEARVATEVLLERTLRIRPRGTPKRINSFLLRGLESLPIEIDPA